ncbi:MAG: hypothetical protein IJQ12_10350 [Lachnospiraceae bacterium]|nr:hypothetical protein [Lachnospiraceae bacterium]
MKQAWNRLCEGANRFVRDESGMGTIEVILIIVVLIGLVMVFKKEIGGLVQDVVSHIKSDAQTIYN